MKKEKLLRMGGKAWNERFRALAQRIAIEATAEVVGLLANDQSVDAEERVERLNRLFNPKVQYKEEIERFVAMTDPNSCDRGGAPPDGELIATKIWSLRMAFSASVHALGNSEDAMPGFAR